MIKWRQLALFKSVVADGTKASLKRTSCTKAGVSQIKASQNTFNGQKGQKGGQKRSKNFALFEHNTELTASRSASITIGKVGLF